MASQGGEKCNWRVREGVGHFLPQPQPLAGCSWACHLLSLLLLSFPHPWGAGSSSTSPSSSSGMALTVDVMGPAPWGFRITGGRDFHTPIMVTKVRASSGRARGIPMVRVGSVYLVPTDTFPFLFWNQRSASGSAGPGRAGTLLPRGCGRQVRSRLLGSERELGQGACWLPTPYLLVALSGGYENRKAVLGSFTLTQAGPGRIHTGGWCAGGQSPARRGLHWQDSVWEYLRALFLEFCHHIPFGEGGCHAALGGTS